jgi:ribosomal protein bL25 (Ctc-form)
MSNKITFSATLRTQLGKKVSQLRKKRLVPANVMHAKDESVAIAVSETGLVSLLGHVSDSSLIYLNVEGEKTARPVMVDEVQLDGIRATPLHVVFRQVSLKEKVKAEVPVVLVGESAVPDSVVVTVHDVVEVEALPTDLPEKFEIDVSTLTEVGQMITFSDLSYNKNEVTLMISEEELSTPVVMLQAHKEEVIEESTEVVEPEITAQGGGDAAEATEKAESEAKE